MFSQPSRDQTPFRPRVLQASVVVHPTPRAPLPAPSETGEKIGSIHKSRHFYRKRSLFPPPRFKAPATKRDLRHKFCLSRSRQLLRSQTKLYAKLQKRIVADDAEDGNSPSKPVYVESSPESEVFIHGVPADHPNRLQRRFPLPTTTAAEESPVIPMTWPVSLPKTTSPTSSAPSGASTTPAPAPATATSTITTSTFSRSSAPSASTSGSKTNPITWSPLDDDEMTEEEMRLYQSITTPRKDPPSSSLSPGPTPPLRDIPTPTIGNNPAPQSPVEVQPNLAPGNVVPPQNVSAGSGGGFSDSGNTTVVSVQEPTEDNQASLSSSAPVGTSKRPSFDEEMAILDHMDKIEEERKEVLRKVGGEEFLERLKVKHREVLDKIQRSSERRKVDEIIESRAFAGGRHSLPLTPVGFSKATVLLQPLSEDVARRSMSMKNPLGPTQHRSSAAPSQTSRRRLFDPPLTIRRTPSGDLSDIVKRLIPEDVATLPKLPPTTPQEMEDREKSGNEKEQSHPTLMETEHSETQPETGMENMDTWNPFERQEMPRNKEGKNGKDKTVVQLINVCFCPADNCAAVFEERSTCETHVRQVHGDKAKGLLEKISFVSQEVRSSMREFLRHCKEDIEDDAFNREMERKVEACNMTSSSDGSSSDSDGLEDSSDNEAEGESSVSEDD